MAINYFAYNFIKIHSTLRVSPAMAAGVVDRLFDVSDLRQPADRVGIQNGRVAGRIVAVSSDNTMPGPSAPSPPFSGEPDTLLARVQRLRQEAEDFQKTVEEELRALLKELKVEQTKRRRHGR